MKKILYHFQNLKSSFWFLPLLIILAGIALAVTFLYIDVTYPYVPKGMFRVVFSGSSNSARSVLSSIGGAMITVAGTVFSITLVVLTLASSQFGPRLLRNFMYKRLNQIVLGIYVSTFLYCLIILNAVKGSEDFTFVPNVSILFAIIMTAVSIGLLVIFIHQVSMSIQPSNIVTEISEELKKSMQTVFLENKVVVSDADPFSALTAIKLRLKLCHHIKINASGYLQYIDRDELLALAEREDLLLDIKFKAGDYIIENVVVAEAYSENVLNSNTIHTIREAFVLASRKTLFQDSEFAIHQIVEIAVKALSPGINDPYTAINCIDCLAASICNLLNIKFPSPYIPGKNDQIRLINIPLTFRGMMDAAFNQIRQFGAGSPSVLVRLMESLQTIYSLSTRDDQNAVIAHHAKMVVDTAKVTFQNPGDFADLKDRYNSFIPE